VRLTGTTRAFDRDLSLTLRNIAGFLQVYFGFAPVVTLEQQETVLNGLLERTV
jgi:hypothetical protein